MNGSNGNSTAGAPGPSGSRQGASAKKHMPNRPPKKKKGNASQGN